jgi:hypothetical protein
MRPSPELPRWYEELLEVRFFGPRTDDNSDDNGDDSCCLSHVAYTTTCALSCLVTACARSWQCGGHVFESPSRPDD